MGGTYKTAWYCFRETAWLWLCRFSVLQVAQQCQDEHSHTISLLLHNGGLHHDYLYPASLKNG